MCHNYWACALGPGSCDYWTYVPQLLSLCSEPASCDYWTYVPQLLSLCSGAWKLPLLNLCVTTTEPVLWACRLWLLNLCATATEPVLWGLEAVTIEPMCRSYWACALGPGSCHYWTYAPQLLKPLSPKAHALQQEKPPQWETLALQLESSPRVS